MMIIFDLDYTLLDTKKLHEKLAEIFDRENYANDHEIYFKDKGINFNLEDYLALLKKQGRINREREKELRQKMKDLLNHFDTLLFKGAEEMLKNFKKSGAELIMLTFGNLEWHKVKINSLSVKKYFDKIIFEEKNKGETKYLKSLKAKKEILIVNDNAKETKEMTEIIGEKAKVFLVNGPYSENIEHSWTVHELAELKKWAD